MMQASSFTAKKYWVSVFPLSKLSIKRPVPKKTQKLSPLSMLSVGAATIGPTTLLQVLSSLQAKVLMSVVGAPDAPHMVRSVSPPFVVMRHMAPCQTGLLPLHGLGVAPVQKVLPI